MPKFTKAQRKTRRRGLRKAGLSASNWTGLGRLKSPNTNKKIAKIRFKERF